ncbi:DUF6607 domain-containing protein [Sulfidibacter corallicola]|uniref:YARHG domain-containing protein n=1 Tax=Sulfidibacter corallicola TaxID=2818388 RepID=A0A8A4TLA5_SULCO|nr:DUF6607 family protein [Sulfidibacter corallicola]QTD50353.1 hypothetical protein J3U87_32615 [Sulfidibacter corallicola]
MSVTLSRLALVATLLAATTLSAAEKNTPEPSPKERDRQAILAMAGTYVVDFHFKETVGFTIGYDLKPAYDSGALETIIVVEDSPEKIVLQHVLQTDHGIIKHWRQDWEFENTQLLTFEGHRTWKKKNISKTEARGTWTQRVFQVDDSPRYEAIGKWVHIGDLSQWESELTNRPLPRREYTKRSDYHILVARNRHALTQTGWVHEQDNFKLALGETPEENKVISREIGLNTYERTLPARLTEAHDWWAVHQQYWADVRKVWNEVYASRKELYLAKKVEDKSLWKHLFDLDETLSGTRSYDSTEARKQIHAAIEPFLLSEPDSGAAY